MLTSQGIVKGGSAMNCVRCGAGGVTVSSGICGPCSQKPYTIPVNVVLSDEDKKNLVCQPGPIVVVVKEDKYVPTQDELVTTMLAAIPRPEGLELEISDEMRSLVKVMAAELVKIYERTK